MNISFSGAQSTGKTTLLDICQRESVDDLSLFNQFTFVPEVTRLVKRKYNLPINERGNDLTQLCIIHQHVENYINNINNNVIMDRCILDGVVYTEYLHEKKGVDKEVLDYARYVYNLLINKIDIIFYTDPEIPLIDDGERSIDIGFRNDIIEKFETYIKPLKNVVRLTGSVEERMEQLKRYIIFNLL